jgi:hypothetical protein
MTDTPNGPWYGCLPGCAAQVPCGQGRHAVRWEAGALVLPEHPDAEGELVLAALGGEKAGCVELAEIWGRHMTDLSVLAIGPRGPADEIAVSWEDVAAVKQARWSFGAQLAPGTRPSAARLPPMRLASPPRALAAHMAGRHRKAQEEMERSRQRTTDMLSLLALGYGFQVRLIGQVAAAYAGRLEDQAQQAEADGGTETEQEAEAQSGATAEGKAETQGEIEAQEGAEVQGGARAEAGARADGGVRVRPALVAAIAGRLAPVAENWLGIDPDQLVVSLHSGPGWGSAELTGHGEERRLRVSVPAGWLASVWACGLALVGRHLVVAVEQPGWPEARVLGLRAPALGGATGAEPVPLEVHGTLGAPGGPPDAPHWET